VVIVQGAVDTDAIKSIFLLKKHIGKENLSCINDSRLVLFQSTFLITINM
jgi:hypothetical protein